MAQLGCKAFALLFDDIEPEMCKQDKEVFQSFAHAQVSVTNEIFQVGNYLISRILGVHVKKKKNDIFHFSILVNQNFYFVQPNIARPELYPRYEIQNISSLLEAN